MDLLTIAKSTKLGLDLYSKFYELKTKNSNEHVANLTINQIIFDGENDGLAVNISLINLTSEPFSILDIRMKSGNDTYNGLYLAEIKTNCDLIDFGYDKLFFKTHINEFTLEVKEELDLNLTPFDINKYLLTNQAETGWVFFNVPCELTSLKFVYAKISTKSELIIADL